MTRILEALYENDWQLDGSSNSCNMGMRDCLICMPEGWGHTYQTNHKCTCYKCYVSLCCHSNNISSLNLTSNCYTFLWDYKYKLLMQYSQANNCDNALWVGIGTPLDQRFVYPPITWTTFPGYIHFSCISAWPFDLHIQWYIVIIHPLRLFKTMTMVS